MEYLLAIILGIIQGVTEFLPISSTAHLLLVESVIGNVATPDNSFAVAVQSGSALALLTIFLPKIIRIAKNPSLFWFSYCLALIPAVILGAAFSSPIKAYLYTPTTFGFSLIIGGLIMIWTEKKAGAATITQTKSIKPVTAFIVGIAQAVALIPGVSRLGATLVGARLLGFDRKTAVEFSFLLAIPILLGAAGHDLVKNRHLLSSTDLTVMALGSATAYCTGLLACTPCIRALVAFGLVPFGWYRLCIGILILLSCIHIFSP